MYALFVGGAHHATVLLWKLPLAVTVLVAVVYLARLLVPMRNPSVRQLWRSHLGEDHPGPQRWRWQLQHSRNASSSRDAG